MIKAAGISLNTLTHKDDGENTDCLQVLCSILDHRVDHCFDHGNRHGFIRGAYLQGMLLMLEKGVFVSKILEKRSKLGELVIPMAELALCNLFAKPCCKSVLTGVKTYERLWKNLRISQLTPLSNVELSAVKKIVFLALEEICVSPFM